MQIALLKGRASSEFAALLEREGPDEIISRGNLVPPAPSLPPSLPPSLLPLPLLPLLFLFLLLSLSHAASDGQRRTYRNTDGRVAGPAAPGAERGEPEHDPGRA
jgi:hypothetical protein